jgi:hypothetical protein
MAGWQRCRLARQSRSSGRSSTTWAMVASCGAAAMACDSTPVSVNARGPPAAERPFARRDRTGPTERTVGPAGN